MNWIFNGEKPIYLQLVEQIELAILMKNYAPGSKLPGVREFAAEAGVNPNTMQRAFVELETRELVFSQRTSGRFVTEDTEKIKNLRIELAKNITSQYFQKMSELGCSKDDIHTLIQQIEEELT